MLIFFSHTQNEAKKKNYVPLKQKRISGFVESTQIKNKESALALIPILRNNETLVTELGTHFIVNF